MRVSAHVLTWVLGDLTSLTTMIDGLLFMTKLVHTIISSVHSSKMSKETETSKGGAKCLSFTCVKGQKE